MKEHPDNHREGKSQEERDRFILSNMGLVHALAHRLKGRGSSTKSWSVPAASGF